MALLQKINEVHINIYMFLFIQPPQVNNKNCKEKKMFLKYCIVIILCMFRLNLIKVGSGGGVVLIIIDQPYSINTCGILEMYQHALQNSSHPIQKHRRIIRIPHTGDTNSLDRCG